ncbi:MAG: transporter [Lentisphaerae bacterium]|nr:transporter [Lentisphaerota bacterium]
MKTPRYLAIALQLGLLATLGSVASGGGITADVGLTPPLDRWIFRSQVRFMERGDDPTGMGREMHMIAAPFVLAYGLRPDVTIIARQIAFHREMEMMTGSTDATGLGDLALISKWKLIRINRPHYIIGVAPTIGVEVPTGDDDFGSDTWDVIAGTFVTGRRGPWGADLNLEYTLNGVDDRRGSDGRPGDVFNANLALSYQFTLDRNATLSLWPVLEVTYIDTLRDQRVGSDVANTGGKVLSVSPGIRFARQSFMLEALIQIPVNQEQNGPQLEQEIGGLVGFRYLF